jgi:hypothetical protein
LKYKKGGDMKSKLLFGVLLLGFVFPVTIHAADAKWSIALTGGWAHSTAGDVNDYRLGYNGYWAQAGNKYGCEVVKECSAIHAGLNLNGEVLYSLASALSLSLGVGYLTLGGGMESDEIHVKWGNKTDIKSIDSTLSAIPVTLGARWTILERRKFRLFAGGGIGLYLSRFKQVYLDEWDAGSGPGSGWGKVEINADALGIGMQGGFGFEYSLGKRIALVLEGFGRYARISGFSGDRRFSSHTGSDSSETGTLYFGESYSTWLSGWYPVITAQDSAPAGDNWRDVAKFSADLSGFALRAGVRISL